MISVNLSQNGVTPKLQSTGIRPSQSLPYEEDMHSPLDTQPQALQSPVAETTTIDALGAAKRDIHKAISNTQENIAFLENKQTERSMERHRLIDTLKHIEKELDTNENERATLQKTLHSLYDAVEVISNYGDEEFEGKGEKAEPMKKEDTGPYTYPWAKGRGEMSDRR